MTKKYHLEEIEAIKGQQFKARYPGYIYFSDANNKKMNDGITLYRFGDHFRTDDIFGGSFLPRCDYSGPLWEIVEFRTIELIEEEVDFLIRTVEFYISEKTTKTSNMNDPFSVRDKLRDMFRKK